MRQLNTIYIDKVATVEQVDKILLGSYSDGYELKAIHETPNEVIYYLDRPIGKIKVPNLSFDIEILDEKGYLKVLVVGLRDFYIHELEDKIKFEIDRWLPDIKAKSISIRNVRS